MKNYRNQKRKHNNHEAVKDRDNLPSSKILTNNSTFTGVNAENLSMKNDNHKYRKIIDESKYKHIFFKYRNGLYRGLLVFTSITKTHCFEYYWSSKKRMYHCRGCAKLRKMNSAILVQNENKNDVIKLENKSHICKPIKYDPKKYADTKIIRKPNYELLNNCSKKNQKHLIVFNENDRSQCYEFFWDKPKQHFVCCGCSLVNKYLVAEVHNENAKNEYILLKEDKHICAIRKYEPEKYSKFYGFVLHPNFEIRRKIKGEIESKKLIILDENDKNLCYIYHFDQLHQTFYCNGCHKLCKNVYAKSCVNEDGEEYMLLSDVKHVCELKPYLKDQNEIILHPPDFKFMEKTAKDVSKLFIFDNVDKNLCYTFSSATGGNNQNRYNCLGCLIVRNSRNLAKDEHLKNVVQVILCKNENGEYYVRMADGQKHICKPRKYEPEKHELTILKVPDYFLFHEKNNLNLVIIHPIKKDMCYKFYRSKSSNLFICSACKHHKPEGIFIYAKFQTDSDENEYITMNQRKHICQPLKISSIKKPGIKILEKLCLNCNGPKIDEERIVRIPDFELQKSSKGYIDRKLIVFKSDDRKLCYSYKLNSTIFRCYKCDATAKLQQDKNENYIILGNKEHTCFPIKYEPEKIINDATNFIVFNRDAKNNRPTKLVTFTSPSKELCYEFTFCKKSQRFRCCECRKMKKQVSAKLLFNKNNKEYVQLYKNEHICIPKKFVLEEFEIEIIQQSDFKLLPNSNGKPNSIIIIFDSEKDGYVYEYRLEHGHYFICRNCKKNGKNVTVKLLENENGEKFLEVLSNQHICESIKYDGKNYK
uniref:Uncharacterized protein n=1 Tax=Panagrolaimus davidi TaxID=227884 RepID=A0A914Q8X2_9BILA